VLLPGVFDVLVAQHLQRAADPRASALRHDDLVDIAPLGGNERICEARLILINTLFNCLWIAQLRAVEDLHRALGAHHRDLGRRPSIVHIAPDVF